MTVWAAKLMPGILKKPFVKMALKWYVTGSMFCYTENLGTTRDTFT